MTAASAPVNGAAIRSEIQKFIMESLLKRSGTGALTDETRLLDGNLLDSISMLELTVHLEETYGIAIAAEEVAEENFGTLGSLLQFLRRKVSPR